MHCEGGISAPEVPLILRYSDQSGVLGLSIWISKGAAIWNHNDQTENVLLDTSWAKPNTAIVYRNKQFSPVRFEDIFGNQVIVSGDGISIEEKIDLINGFEYIGSDPQNTVSPWSQEWCKQNAHFFDWY